MATEQGVEELTLESNGLRVLLLPDPSVPVVATCIVYHVGSRNEAVGHTGSTHLLEHLLFKGSRAFNPAEGRPIARALERVGAAFNATTWFDRTNYFETLPAEHLDLALELEADRMRAALLLEADLASEMTVVRNEFERGENDPFDLLLKDSFAIAFREHPYHHPTIGWRSDIESASIERLRSFYDTFYYPDNATLILIGAIEREAALERVRARFGPLPRAPRPIHHEVTREPAQLGERRFIIRRAGEVGWVAVSWRTPQAGHPDTHALAVLADGLSGGVTSRLFQKLVEPGICLEVQAVSWQLRDPGLFQVFATLAPGASHEAVEAAIRAEVAAIAASGLQPEEVERAVMQVEAQTAFHRDSPSQVAAALSEAVACADWRFYLEYPARVRAVAAADAERVAKTYLHDDAVSVGWFVPRDGSGGASHLHAPAPQPHRPRPCTARPRLSEQVLEASLPGGGRLLMLPRRVNPTVHLHGSLLAGHALLPSERWSAASLVPDMLERGTAEHSRLELARAVEDRGIELDVSGESFNPLEVFTGARCLARDTGLVLDLLAAMLRGPSFPAEELDKLRQLRLGELAQANEDTFQRAFEAFSRLIYVPGHPFYRRELDERRRALEQVSVADLHAVHRELFGPASLVIAMVGDFEPAEVQARLSGLLDGWAGGVASLPEVPRLGPGGAEPRETRIPMADKPNLDAVLGHPGGLRRTDPDFIAAMLGNAVLGHSTLSSRLGRRLRDQEGLTYGVISRFFGASLVDGPFATTFSVSPADLERGLAAAREEIGLLLAEGPSEEELTDERLAMAGSYRVSLSTPGGIARELSRLARHGLGVASLDDLPDAVLATSREEVLAALARHIDPGRLSVAVAGELVDPPAGRG